MKILIPLGNQPQSERGSVTRSNALSPDRVRVSITTPAGLANLLRFTEPRSARPARNPKSETHARFPNQGKSSLIKASDENINPLWQPAATGARRSRRFSVQNEGGLARAGA